MKLSLLVVGVTSIAQDWLSKNWGEVIKLGIFALIIITSMQQHLDYNTQQLSTLQLGQLRLTEKVERVQIDVVRTTQQLIGLEKSLANHAQHSKKD